MLVDFQGGSSEPLEPPPPPWLRVCMVLIERAYHNEHVCQIPMLYHTSEDMSHVKVFVTDGQTNNLTDE